MNRREYCVGCSRMLEAGMFAGAGQTHCISCLAYRRGR